MQQGLMMARTRTYELKSGVRGNSGLAAARGPDRVVYSTTRDVLNAPARDDKPTNDARERAETMSVALAQPHRKGSEDPRRATALGRFCADHRPVALGNHCWLAGVRYAEIVREAKNAQGFAVHGWAPGDGGYEILDDRQLEARKELSLMRLREAEATLRAIMPRLPGAMERLTYDELDPSPYDAGVLVHGLVALAIEWGFLKPKFGT